MDLAQTLIRSYARTFYGVEYILVLDAVIVHSALPGDDLAYVLGSQVKYTRKLCNKLREDGVLHLHNQQEIKQGAFRAGNREYYYINMHKAIDSIKWRLKSLTNAIEAKYGQDESEKKDYSCEQCRSEYTEFEVLDSVDFDGNFFCKRCGQILSFRPKAGENSVGHEKHSKLNFQLQGFEELMKRIDDASIAENEWEHAYENRRPVARDQAINPGVKSQVVSSRVGPATVHGKQLEQEKLQVELLDAAAAREAEVRKNEMDRSAAAQNQLPIWHTNSTVTGEQTELGRKEAEQRREREGGILLANGSADEKDKKSIEDMEESEQMRAYKAAVRAAAEQEAAEDEDEDEEEGEDEDDEGEFEDVELAPRKRMKLDDAMDGTVAAVPAKSNGEAAVNGSKDRSKTPDVSKPVALKLAAGEEEDSDEDANFEDVL